MRALALDTEDDGAGRPFLFNFFDGESHYTFRDRMPAWNWLRQRGPAIVWACNMEYDLNNLFGDWLEEILTLTYNQSAFIKAHWPGHNICFRDTLRHWPLGVAEMGKYLGLAKLEAAGPGNKFDDVEYCRRDTEIVFKFAEEMGKRYKKLGADVKNTLPSSAFDLYKREYCPVDLTRPRPEICDLLMGAAFGGRTEIFKTGLLTGPIDCYDVNSLYPSVMRNHEYPLPESGRFSKKLDLGGEFIAAVDIKYPEIYIPGLPLRHDGKMIFPAGRFSGTWTAPELRQAEKDGAKIEKVKWVYNYSQKCRPFEKWVDKIYSLRKSATDELMKYTLKLFLNSVFGKMTEAGKLQIYKKRKRTDLENRPDHANIVLGVYTTAYGRLRLLSEIRGREREICYTDTDSIFLRDHPPLATGQELGEWKHEGKFGLAEFVLPKFYMTVDAAGKRKFKSKGIPRAAVEDFFERGEAEYRKPVRFREARRRMIPANVWEKKIRTLRATYTKRRVIAGGDTAPVLLGV